MREKRANGYCRVNQIFEFEYTPATEITQLVELTDEGFKQLSFKSLGKERADCQFRSITAKEFVDSCATDHTNTTLYKLTDESELLQSLLSDSGISYGGISCGVLSKEDISRRANSRFGLYSGFERQLRSYFSELEPSKVSGFETRDFSAQRSRYRCVSCSGSGVVKVSNLELGCESCLGSGLADVVAKISANDATVAESFFNECLSNQQDLWQKS